MQDREGRTGLSLQGMIVALLFGGIIALAVCCLLLFICSIMLVAGLIPERIMSSLCIILCGISSLIGGHFAIRRGDGPPLVLGLMTGAFLCILILIIGFSGYPEASLTGTSLWILLSALVGGGIAGLSKPNKKRKKRRKK
jgi:putative membrane protein (TIGR04086 family)